MTGSLPAIPRHIFQRLLGCATDLGVRALVFGSAGCKKGELCGFPDRR